MAVLEHLEPQAVFGFFEELSKIPRETFDSKRASDYCVEFAKARGLSYIQDAAHNVIIKKAGTAGYEESEPVIIQGHLDMVCVKTEDSEHDFKNEPLDIYVEDGYIKARGTSLGGDDGIAVAYALAILDSEEIPHPPLEVLFTADEEVGMVGAGAIDLSVLEGKMLINMDSEAEGTILAGCAGAFTYNMSLPVEREEKNGAAVTISVSGLLGGHSGIEIHEQRGNAHKIVGRILNSIKTKYEYYFMEMNGGTKENVIAFVSKAKIMVRPEDAEAVKAYVEELAAVIKAEFGNDEQDLKITADVEHNIAAAVCTKESTEKIVFLLIATPNGVREYSRALKGLVETSNNLGAVKTTEDHVELLFMPRSSVESKKKELKELLDTFAAYTGASVDYYGDYPGWMYKIDSKLRPIAVETYEQMFGKEPIVTTIHAGLECGLLSGKKPELDCISFGPNMHDAHSVNEKLDVASTQRMWNYLLAVLRNCK